MQNEDEDSLTRRAPKKPRIYTTLADYREQRPGAPHGTWWLNPTETVMTARLHVGPRAGFDPRARKEMLTWDGAYLVRIEPGATPIELPSEWDDAIQTVRGGRVVAGMMPRAQRVADPSTGLSDPEPVPLHPALEERAAPARRRRKAGA